MELEEMIFNECLKYWNQITHEYNSMIKKIGKKIKIDTLTNDNVKVEVSRENDEYCVDILLYKKKDLFKKINHITNKEEFISLKDSNNQTIVTRSKKMSKLKYNQTITSDNNCSYINNEDKIYENISQSELLLALHSYLNYQANFKILAETKCNNRTFKQMYKEKIDEQREYIELLYEIEENIDILFENKLLLTSSIELVKKKHSK